MREIKTRDSVTKPDRLIRNRYISSAMKKAYIRSKRQAEEVTNNEQESAESYASDIFEHNTEQASENIQTAGRRAASSSRGKRSAIRTRDRRAIGRRKPVGASASTQAGTSSASAAREAGTVAGRSARSVQAQSVTAARRNAAATKAVKDSKRAAELSKQAADKAKKTAKAAAKALKAVIKGTINAVKGLVAIIASGGAVAVVIIIIICLVGLIAASAYGIFAGNEVSGVTDGDASRDLRYAISKINTEYYEKLQHIRDRVENLQNFTITINGEVGAMTGVWQDVLSVYAVDTAHGVDAVLAIDFDESKTNRLREIFWSMVTINYHVTERIETTETETVDENGNVVISTVEIIASDLNIYVTTKSPSAAAAIYDFSPEQNKILTELMSDRFTKAWSNLIYGYSYGDDDIVAVAVSQIGNIGGEPYWRWYGLSSRTEWCAIFVSWCADQCGYIDMGTMPRFAWVPDGVAWFQARGQWQTRDYTPAPGDIIFFDWDHDGGGNHVGIVEYCENGIVHTIEGNSSDQCRRKTYTVGIMSILGYGLPTNK